MEPLSSIEPHCCFVNLVTVIDTGHLQTASDILPTSASCLIWMRLLSSIELYRPFVHCSFGNSFQSRCLDNLAMSMQTKFKHRGTLLDLDETIESYRAAPIRCPINRSYWPYCFSNHRPLRCICAVGLPIWRNWTSSSRSFALSPGCSYQFLFRYPSQRPSNNGASCLTWTRPSSSFELPLCSIPLAILIDSHHSTTFLVSLILDLSNNMASRLIWMIPSNSIKLYFHSSPLTNFIS
jgi:hypothetical protein